MQQPSTTGGRIRELREQLSWTQKELADRVGAERATVASWETDRRVPETEGLKRLADVLSVSTDYLLCLTDARPGAATGAGPAMGVQHTYMEQLPLLGRIRAGVPLLSEQNTTGYIDAPVRITRKADFALEVSGDSMVGAGIQPGDIVFMRLATKQPPMHGNIVAAMVDQGDMTLKRYVKRNGSFWLMAENPQYTPIPVNERVQIQGVYVARYTEHEGVVEPPLDDMTEDELITQLAKVKGLDPDAVRHLLEAARALKPRT